ncbi:MAG: shikimate kinase AroK [Pseudomonadota bacterium]
MIGAADRIVIIGPMGSGKTAVGRQLARMLGYDFADSDHEVEERTGVDISFIFEKEGEEGFRKRERAAIDDLTQRSGVVLATGGGAVLDEQNRRHMVSRGYCVYLRASIEQQLARTSNSRHRPLLEESDDKRARLEELMGVREPLYVQVADFVVDTDGRRVDAVAKDIKRHLDTPQ